MYKKRNEVTLKEAINQLLDSYKIKNKLKAVELTNQWPKLVGPMIARHTKELYMKQDTLVLKFDSAPLKQEVAMMKTRLMVRLNEALGEEIIKDIVLL